MKIGVLGGSFNPPHKQHLKLGEILIKRKVLDKVIYVPNITNPIHDKKMVDKKDRYEMVKLLIKDNVALEVSDIEIKKDKQNYGYQTMDELKKLYPNDDLYLIIGSDILKELENWKESEYLIKNYKIMPITRLGFNINKLINSNEYLKSNRSSIYPVNILIPSGISSTKVRNNINNSQKYLTKEVYKYILQNNLY